MKSLTDQAYEQVRRWTAQVQRHPDDVAKVRALQAAVFLYSTALAVHVTERLDDPSYVVTAQHTASMPMLDRVQEEMAQWSRTSKLTLAVAARILVARRQLDVIRSIWA